MLLLSLVLNATQEIQVFKVQLYIMATLDQLDMLVKPVMLFKKEIKETLNQSGQTGATGLIEDTGATGNTGNTALTGHTG